MEEISKSVSVVATAIFFGFFIFTVRSCDTERNNQRINCLKSATAAECKELIRQ